jgi:hypothetical protein
MNTFGVRMHWCNEHSAAHSLIAITIPWVFDMHGDRTSSKASWHGQTAFEGCAAVTLAVAAGTQSGSKPGWRLTLETVFVDLH